MKDVTAPEFLSILAARGVTMSKQGFKQSVLKAMEEAGAARQADKRGTWLIDGNSINKWLDYLVWFNQNKKKGRGYKYDISEFVTENVTNQPAKNDKL